MKRCPDCNDDTYKKLKNVKTKLKHPHPTKIIVYICTSCNYTNCYTRYDDDKDSLANAADKRSTNKNF